MTEAVTEQRWRWCLVGNIVKTHEYGEEKEIRFGSKQFAPGAKVYMAPAQWGDGYEKIVVIGCPRHRKKYIELVIRSELIENFRIQMVYAPFLLSMMENSQYTWWDDLEETHQELSALINSLQSNRGNE